MHDTICHMCLNLQQQLRHIFSLCNVIKWSYLILTMTNDVFPVDDGRCEQEVRAGPGLAVGLHQVWLPPVRRLRPHADLRLRRIVSGKTIMIHDYIVTSVCCSGGYQDSYQDHQGSSFSGFGGSEDRVGGGGGADSWGTDWNQSGWSEESPVKR